VPRAYDISGAYEGMEGRKKEKEKVKKEKVMHNEIQDFKKHNLFQRLKFYYKPACKVGSV
jgi:hypothetical protein